MGDPAPAPVLSSPRELQAVLAAQRAGTPFLVFRDGAGAQQVHPLDPRRPRLHVGRGRDHELCLEWDGEVSRLHAELELLGTEWTVADDGLSRNGTWVNGERITGRRRLRDGDVVRCGRTAMTFHRPAPGTTFETAVAADVPDARALTPAQRRVLVALCRPYKESTAYATPAGNQAIADELVLSVEAVKTHMRTLFAKFGVEDLPQNRKRIRLVELALRSGVITPRDL